jgi:catechol 2,3-dioxygenase-like lactoylglutathione lyase family enzyme/ketosteroid isomerase-like protein
VRDVAATCAFYRRALGMEVITFGQGRTALRFGAQKINLHPVGGGAGLAAGRPTPGSADICLLAREPVGTWLEHLRALGVKVEEGPVTRTGALGPIESIYLRDPDGNLVEIANQRDPGGDAIAPLRAWLRDWQARVQAGDFAGGRALCAPELLAFGTRAEIAEGLDDVVERQWRHVWPRIRSFTVRADEARGGIDGDRGWVAAQWESLGVRPDGTTFRRPGRLTVLFAYRDGRWLATHTHFSLTPGPGGERTS